METLKIIAYIFVGCAVLISLIRTVFLYIRHKRFYEEEKKQSSILKSKKNMQNIYSKARIHNHGEPIDDSVNRLLSLSISYKYTPDK